MVCALDSDMFSSLSIAWDSRFTLLNGSINFVENIEMVVDLFRWVAVMAPSDYYGPNYLLDLVLGTRYSSAEAFGKGSFYELINNQLVINRDSPSYKALKSFNLRSSIISMEIFLLALRLNKDILGDFTEVEVSDGVSLDYFGYCKNAYVDGDSRLDDIREVVDDHIQNPGSSLDELYSMLSLPDSHSRRLGSLSIRAIKLANFFGDRFTRDITGSLDRFGWHIISELPDGDTCDLFSEFAIPIEDLGGQSGTPFYMEAGVGLQMQLLVRFEESSGALVEEALFELNAQNQLIPPITCTHARLGYRFTSSGSSRITRLVLA